MSMKERKTRRVQLALRPSLYDAVVNSSSYAGFTTLTACIEGVLFDFVLRTRKMMDDERNG